MAGRAKAQAEEPASDEGAACARTRGDYQIVVFTGNLDFSSQRNILMTVAATVKRAAKKTEKTVIDPVVKGTKKLLKPVAKTLKGNRRKSSSRSKTKK